VSEPLLLVNTEKELVMEEFNALGPAEEFAVKQLREAIEGARKEAKNLVEELDKIDCDLIEDAVLDPERRKAIIELVPTVQKMPQNLGMSALIPLVVGVLLKPKEPTAA
jgi:hypothetical protein